MITGEIKSKVGRIWDTLWSGGNLCSKSGTGPHPRFDIETFEPIIAPDRAIKEWTNRRTSGIKPPSSPTTGPSPARFQTQGG